MPADGLEGSSKSAPGVHRAEIVLVLLAAVLLSVGLFRALARGEEAAQRWPTYAMVILLVVAAVNVVWRSRAAAGCLTVTGGLLLATVAIAAAMPSPEDGPHPILAVARAALFLACIVAAGALQWRRVEAPPGARIDPD